MKRVISIAFAPLALAACLQAQVESLPAPVVNGNSFEILSNSRYSIHHEFTDTLSRQVLSNVLWAMNRVPHLGDYREFYVATPENVYRYGSLAHALVVHRTGDFRYNAGAAFEVGIACERHEEAGFAVQAGLLAGTAFWNPDSANVASCPMEIARNWANSYWNPAESIKMVDVFGRATTIGLTTVIQARSSDSTLTTPRTDGADTFEMLLAGGHQDSLFAPDAPSSESISQILWAGYGVTPHRAYNGYRGTTIPTAAAQYYLTRLIYLVTDSAVFRYSNRLPPGTGLTTSDHRIEVIVSGDRRPQLRAACTRIPSTAPAYIVVCVLDTSRYRDLQEAGFAGFQYLMQAASLGLQGFLTTPLAVAERHDIIVALGIPNDQPALVFAFGSPQPAPLDEAGIRTDRSIALRVVGNRPPVRIDYSLGSVGSGKFVIYDLAGRPVRTFELAPQTPGPHGLDWNGAGESGQPVPSGVYICRLEAGGAVSSTHVVISR